MLRLLIIFFTLLGLSVSADKNDDLIYYASAGNVEKVKSLLAAKANVNARYYDGGTPLIGAARYGHTEVVRLLIEAKANVNVQVNYKTALDLAIMGGYDEIFHLLLKAKINPNTGNLINNGERIPLIRSIDRNRLDYAQSLIKAGANVNVKIGPSMETPLFYAVFDDKIDFVKLFIASKANVNAVNEHNQRLLSKAKSAEMRKVLTEAGAKE